MTVPTITLGDFPEKPTQEQVDCVMMRVSYQLGGTWTAARHRNLWHIYRDDKLFSCPPRRRFDVALGQATGCAIVAQAPVRIVGSHVSER